MSEQPVCNICRGLGFRSLDDQKLDPMFNVWGLTRRTHAGGRVTWEGPCIPCDGTGLSPKPQQGYENRVGPFGLARGWFGKSAESRK